jgi:hypothetical protein
VTDKPDFRELVGDDLTPEESARLERVHDLLVAAGPPPELPPRLAEPDPERRDEAVAFLPRRRAGLALGIAAALTLVAFVGGFVAGKSRQTFKEAFAVPMTGVAQAAPASAVIHVGEADASGNWPLKVDVSNLKRLPQGQYYEMFLTRNGKPVATCGTFRLSSGQSVRLNAPYNLRAFTGWVVTREQPGSGRHPVVLRTKAV